MKRSILIATIMIVSILFTSALYAASKTQGDREMDESQVTTYGNIALQLTNYGVIGADNGDLRLEWPRGSGVNYLFVGGLWFGGKVHRTNDAGEILYWLHWPPEDEDDCITESDPYWEPDLLPVIDTLTSVGFDGDMNLMELLPAYNPAEANLMQDLYDLHNNDDVLTMIYDEVYQYDDDNDGLIDEDPPGKIFDWNDPQGIYCFNLPYDDDGDGLVDEDGGYPGQETALGYCLDISPFGTLIERDWGSSHSSSHHFPLGIAIEQRVYAWDDEPLQDAIVLHYRITNVGSYEIYDYAVSYYLDADIEDAGDDVSSVVPGHNIPYSYDQDFDNGTCPGLLAMKLIGEAVSNESCFTWSVGNGPEDDDPRDLYPGGSPTANQKYWLQRGTSHMIWSYAYTSLIDNPDYQIDDPDDTRFMYSVSGVPGSFNLQPGETRDFYVALFLAESEDGLVEIYSNLATLHANDFDLSIFDGNPSVPAILRVQPQPDGQSLHIDWNVELIPDELLLSYKQSIQPETEWQELVLDVETSEYTLSDLAELTDYDLKVVAGYGDSFFESETVTCNTDYYLDADEEEIPPVEARELSNHPNPFNPSTTISFSLPEASDVQLDIYNIRGEKVRTLLSEQRDAGHHDVIWNGMNDTGKTVASGIYFARMESGGEVQTRKMLMIK